MYESKNRLSQPLPVLELRVEHAGGSYKVCPNGMVACAIWAHTGEKPDLPDKFLLPGSELFNPKALEPLPGLKSLISGNPAVMYRADDLEIALAPEELFRFASHRLRSDEYIALRDRFGMFHEIHEDFYDPDSGVALQPMFEEASSEEDQPTPLHS